MTERRTWDLPPEPGPEVTAVVDRDEDCWFRIDSSWVSADTLEEARQIRNRGAVSWEEGPALYLPLIDVTPAGSGETPDLREQFDALTNRLRAAILDVVDESGKQSPQHLRLLYVLTGQGDNPLTPISEATVRLATAKVGEV